MKCIVVVVVFAVVVVVFVVEQCDARDLRERAGEMRCCYCC